MIAILSLFQFALTVNKLNSSAILIGRELARDSGISHSLDRTQSLINSHDLDIKDFHVMHFPIGERVFLQLVLVGKDLRVGFFSVTPSARSLTLQDKW
jgi:hypothetical protein